MPRISRVLITGATGFCGRHTAQAFHERGTTVCGFARRTVESMPWLVRSGDVADAEAVGAVLREFQPDGLIHLAGSTDTRSSYRELHEANALAMEALLEAIHREAPATRVVVVSSGAVYGAATESEMPLMETTPLRPLTAYGVSKVAQELIALQKARVLDLPVMIARPFNISGPGEPERLVAGGMARQIARIEAGRAAELHAGNLESQRDFTDVRDVARALMRLLEDGTPGESYNICSGKPRRIREVLDSLIAASITSQIPVTLRPVRIDDVPVHFGSSEKLRAATGWSPEIAWEETLQAVLESSREEIAREK